MRSNSDLKYFIAIIVVFLIGLILEAIFWSGHPLP